MPSILEAAGGLKIHAARAGKGAKKEPETCHPNSPICYLFWATFLLGTGHGLFDHAYHWRCGIEERDSPWAPNGGSFCCISTCDYRIATPAAVVYYLAQLSDIQHSITLLSILLVTVPATLFGTLLLSLYSLKRGKELNDDPDYQERLKDPEWKAHWEQLQQISLRSAT